MKAQIQERIVTVDVTLEEAERAKKQYRFSLSNFGATTEEEKIASMMAQTAYQKYQTNNYTEAVELYQRAIKIAPRFPSLYRNWAIMESMEAHWEDADKLMEKAAKLNPKDTQIWLVWGNMKRKNDKIKDAYSYYQKAYDLSPKDNVVLNSYAQAICRLGDYEKADGLFREALELEEGGSHNKHLIINYTSIADNLKKWSEALLEDRNYDLAEEKIKDALDCIGKVLELDTYDNKANDLYRNILYTYGNVYVKKRCYPKAKEMFEKVVNLPRGRFKEMEYCIRAKLELAEMCIHEGKITEIDKYLTKEVEKDIRRINKNSISEKYKWIQNRRAGEMTRKKGTIVNYKPDKKYVVIKEDNSEITYLTFLNAFSEYVALDDELLGRSVTFIPKEEANKNYAENVKFVYK